VITVILVMHEFKLSTAAFTIAVPAVGNFLLDAVLYVPSLNVFMHSYFGSNIATIIVASIFHFINNFLWFICD
jgi:hypothetical protein